MRRYVAWMHDPATIGQYAVAAAWFVDPSNPAQWRWWDGTQWTAHVAPMQAPAAGGQVAQAVPAQDARAAHEAARRAAGYWPVPAADAPLFPAMDFSRTVFASFRESHRATMLRRLPGLLLWSVLAFAVIIIGVFATRVTNSVLALGMNISSRARWSIRDESRTAPWGATFAARGLLVDERPPWLLDAQAMLELKEARVVAYRWVASGDVAGMPACCGELIQERVDDDGRESRRYQMFACLQLPPLAAARHRGVTVRKRRSVRVTRIWGGSKRLELESIAVSKALEVEVHAQADDVAARELFGPQLVARLADHPVEWDQRHDLLLVFRDSPKEPAAAFDEFMETAAAVARAYWTDQD